MISSSDTEIENRIEPPISKKRKEPRQGLGRRGGGVWPFRSLERLAKHGGGFQTLPDATLTLGKAKYRFFLMRCGELRFKLESVDSLQEYFHVLLDAFGPQRWWPARTRLEVILGTILTQNTAWRNAALGLRELRRAGRLSWAGLRAASLVEIEKCVRPAGFYRQKARVIRNFVDWLEHVHGGSLTRLFAQPAEDIRRQLLELKGVGPETADAILLYVGRHPTFVADAYTRRVLVRHGFLPPDCGYTEGQQFLHRHLPRDPELCNELHALFVEVGKRHCRRRAPKCQGCPLERYLPSPAGSRSAERTCVQAPFIAAMSSLSRWNSDGDTAAAIES